MKPFTFRSFQANPRDVIMAKHLTNFGKKTRTGTELESPLGCLYEPGSRQWIVTSDTSEAGNVRFFDARGGLTQSHVAVADSPLMKPSALALLEAGRSFAVLDKRGIWTYDLRNKKFLESVTLQGPYRGLGVTDDRHFVTVRCSGVNSKICLCSSAEAKNVIVELPYNMPYLGRPRKDGKGASGPQPSFLDCRNNRICVTDLGTGSFTVYSLEKRGARPHLTTVMQKQCLAPEKGSTVDGTFKYISGVKLDDNGEIWICDATGRSIQWLDKDGKFISRLRFSDGFCYTSNFALNTEDKQLLASARHDNIAKLYDLGSQSAMNVDLRSRFVD